jgi:hypothetical protein
LPVVGKSRVLKAFKIVLWVFRPALSEIGALRLVAVIETNNILAVQLSLQIN